MQPLKKRPNDIDREIACRIKARRQLVGYNQKSLADKIGVSYQQVQKYENGSDRVGASRLYAISKALCVHISYFFDAQPEHCGADPRREIIDRPLDEGDRELILFFSGLRNKKSRKKTVEFFDFFSKIDEN